MVTRMTRPQYLQWVEEQRAELRSAQAVDEKGGGGQGGRSAVRVEVEEEAKEQLGGMRGASGGQSRGLGEVRVMRREVEGGVRERRELSFDSQIAVDPAWGTQGSSVRPGGGLREAGKAEEGGKVVRRGEVEKGLKGVLVRRGRWAERRVREGREEAKEGVNAKGKSDGGMKRDRKWGEVKVASVAKLAALFPPDDDGQAS